MCVHGRVYLSREFCADKVQLRVQAGPFLFQLAFLENERKEIKENEKCIEDGKINRNSLPLSVIFW